MSGTPGLNTVVVGIALIFGGAAFTVAGLFVGDYFLFELGFPVALIGAVTATVGTWQWAISKTRPASPP